MKILKLEFENINSLAGKWTLDFTASAFAENNEFFAITGPTGAGKSSVLDAICLGLYGETPRQGEITSDNQVMTKGMKSCFARVTYECRKGVYRSHWEQSLRILTKGKNKGIESLDDYECSIEKEENGKWISLPDLKGRSALAAATAGILGLDYAQFTKSILLAQGAFSEFVKSDSNVRSAILEKLTGSGKYRLIAQKVYERAKNEKERRESKQREIETCAQMLDAEKYAASKADIGVLSAKQKNFDKEQAGLVGQLNWLESLAVAKKNFDDARAMQEAASEENERFAPQAKRLDVAERASKAEAAYKLFAEAQKGLDADRREQAETEKKLADEKEKLFGAEKELQAISAQCEEGKRLRAEQEPIWDAVSALDQKIAAADRSAQEKQKAQTDAETTFEKHRAALRKNAEELTEAQKAHAAEEKYQGEHSADGSLSDDLSRLQEEVRELRKEQAELGTLREKRKSAEAALAAAEKTLKAETEKLAGSDSYLKEHAQDEKLTQEVSRFETLKDTLLKARKDCSKAGKEKSTWESKASAAEKELASADAALEKATAEKNALEADGLPKIAAALRSHLKAGEPCPVCGSREHSSYSCDSAAELGTASALASQLNGLADKERRADMASHVAKVKLEDIRNNLKQAESSLNEMTGSAKAQEAALAEAWRPWNLSVAEDAIECSFAVLKKCSEDFSAARTSRDACQESLSHGRESLNAAKAALDACLENVARSEGRISEFGRKLATGMGPWFSAFRVEDAEALLQLLEVRKKAWQTSLDKAHSLDTALSGLHSAAEKLAENISAAKKTLADAEQDLATTKDALKKLRAERREMFGDKDVASEKRALAEKIKTQETDLERSIKTRDAARSLCDGLQGKWKTLSASVKSGTVGCAQKKASFENARVLNGFASDDEFLAARLADEDRSALAEKREKLRNALASAEGSVVQASSALETCRAKKLCAEDAASALTERQNALRKEQEKNQSDLENARIFCREYEANEKKTETLRQELVALNASYEKWAVMQAWFGKQNGGDFVEFVQGITFGSLLQEANKQLVRMAPRYEFFQKPDKPLELWIVDHDNGDEERPVSNLSGGETFLASLALALGIASLASENVSVDTLFLDEGFGTLDDKVLHNVITVLQELQKRDGKMLGIITHVDTLKNEIPLQIRVERIVGNEGHSRLVCDGVVSAG
jgi:exonuclease SbcC